MVDEVEQPALVLQIGEETELARRIPHGDQILEEGHLHRGPLQQHAPVPAERGLLVQEHGAFNWPVRAWCSRKAIARARLDGPKPMPTRSWTCCSMADMCIPRRTDSGSMTLALSGQPGLIKASLKLASDPLDKETPMRVVMFGYQTWGHRTLQALLDSEHEVVLVVTHPRAITRTRRIWSDSVADCAGARRPGAVRDRPDDEELLTGSRTPTRTSSSPPTGGPGSRRRSSACPGTAPSTCTTRCCRPTPGFSPLIWALINGEQEVGRDRAHDGRRTWTPATSCCSGPYPSAPADTATDLFHRRSSCSARSPSTALDLIASGRTDWSRRTGRRPASSTSGPSEDRRHRLDLAGRGHRAAGPGAVRPVPERLHLPQGPARARSLKAAVVSRASTAAPRPDLHPRGRRRGHRRRRRGPPRPSHGLAIERVRTEDGPDLPATELLPHHGRLPHPGGTAPQ